MKIGVRHRSFSAWLAILAIALQALWPLLSQAKPRSVTLVPICTVGGETHFVELETGGPAPHEEHCKACPIGAAALTSTVRDFSVPEAVRSSFGEQAACAEPRFVSHVRPRAPPSLLSARLIPDNFWRKDEKAIAVRHRGARDAAAGRGVMRRGVLLD